MVWREITPEDFNAMKTALVIDVRSPCEHAVERIPNSVNIPLLSDSERAEVGTIYKQEGELTARRHALKIISPKIPPIIEEIAALKRHGTAAVVYCWRGGLRSEAVASVLSIAGIDCFRLKGGYKAWRAQVLKDFSDNPYVFESVVLHGMTGCGKTEILTELAKAGQQVIDLEAIANHRGSVFGGLGLGDQPTQKNFDAALWMALRELKPSLTYMEAESRKIGRIALPDCVYERIQSGVPVLVTGSVARRAERITADYLNAARGQTESETAQGLELLDVLKERLGNKMVSDIKALVAKGEILEAVQILLVEYYDPLYAKQIARFEPYTLTVDGDNVQQAAKNIIEANLIMSPKNQPLKRTSPQKTPGGRTVVVD